MSTHSARPAVDLAPRAVARPGLALALALLSVPGRRKNTIRMAGLLATGAGLLGAGALAPTAASAATAFGSDLTIGAGPAGIGGAGVDVNLTPPAGSTTPIAAPVSGVIVQIRQRHWNTGATPGHYAYRIESGSGADNGTGYTSFTARPATPTGTNEPLSWTPNSAAGLETYTPKDAEGRPRGVPIAAGERLGMWRERAQLADNTGAPTTFRNNAGSFAYVPSDHTSGAALYEIFGVPLHSWVQGLIEPDADNDGYGDESQDPCPSVAGLTCPAPQPTTPVQYLAPAIGTVSASFVTDPESPCTNSIIKLDASGSTTSSGRIVKYRWNFANADSSGAAVDAFGKEIKGITTDEPTAQVTIGYAGLYSNGHTGDLRYWLGFRRDPVWVGLHVTNNDGVTVSTARKLIFPDGATDRQGDQSPEVRDFCSRQQKALSHFRWGLPEDYVVRATSSRATVEISNPAPVQVTGTVSMLRLSGSGRLSAAAAGSKKPIARGPFAVAPKQKHARVKVPLTRAGKRLLRQHRSLKVRVEVLNHGNVGRKRIVKTLKLVRMGR